MKHLTLSKNCSVEAIKRFTLPKNLSNEVFNYSLPRFIPVNTIWIHTEIAV
jgi:hypothetical protein